LTSRAGYVVLLESTDGGAHELGLAVTQMGLRPLFLLDPQLYRADHAMILQGFEYLAADTRNVDALVSLLAEDDRQVVGVATLVDSRIPFAVQLAAALGVPGPDPACGPLSDKRQVARWCPEASPRSVVAAAGPQPVPDTLAGWQQQFGSAPVVVKPRVGCGAVGVQVLADDLQKQEFATDTPDLQEWLVQEYFPGDLFSMEGWVNEAGVSFAGWTSRRKIGNTETEFRFEGFDSLPVALTKQAQDTITHLVEQASLRRGWFHIEFLVDAARQQLRLIDANVGRTGGAMLPHVMAMALGVSAADLYQHALETQLHGKSSVTLPETPLMPLIYKCVCFGSPRAVTLREVRLPGNLLQQKPLRVLRILGAGDEVSEIGQDDWSWIGFVAGPENQVDQYTAQIEIHTADAVLPAAN
jgi:ATP-grasp domain